MLSAPRNIHLGSGHNLYDFTYAPNLGHAHVLAAQNLLSVSPADPSNAASAAGKAFFVTNDEPLPFRTFLTMVWAASDASTGRQQVQAQCMAIPRPVATALVWISEKASRIARKEPVLTVSNLGDSLAQRWFDNSSAKAILGYVPSTTVARGLDEAMAGWKTAAKAESTWQV
jgi:sterol-4alpha-carboxylate 3-dehydrogenase (decarboxylating)